MRRAVLIAPGYDYARNVRSLVPSPPLSILALGSYLSASDIPVELIDVQTDFGFGLTHAVERVIFQRVAQYLHDQAEAIAWVGISQLSNSRSGITLAQEIRAALPDVPIILGGYFPSSVYRFLLEKYSFITAIVCGDGEAAALQISASLAQGRSFLSASTPNLAWLDGDEIRTTPVQPVALGDLPIFDFRLLRNPSCYQTVSLITSRGCPFHCNYCLESNMRPYAMYPPAWVARQLAHIESELPNTHISISDPLFGIGRKRTLEICQIMGEHRFTYGLESRVDVLAPDLVPTLYEAGVEIIFLGIESASPATLLRMNKVRSVAEAEDYIRDALKVLKACFESNVMPLLGFMLGFPGDSEADLQATLEFTKAVNQLYNRIAEQTGVRTGFVPSPQPTVVYDGSPLAERMGESFPEADLRPEPFIGERMVVSPSPSLDVDTILLYEEKIKSCGEYTPRTLELIDCYYVFPAKDFVEAHPELTDDQGVTVLGAGLRRLPQETNIPPQC